VRHPAWLGTIRRTTPLSDHYGRDRGTPVDRYYIEQFLASEHAAIRGRVLEVMNRDYTVRFGAAVDSSDVLDIDPGNPDATIVGDLADAPHIPDDSFDCAIVTQTLPFVYDIRAALATLHRILAPGGVLLATVPGITKISPPEDETWGEWWHLTSRSAQRLAEEAFGEGAVEVQAYGNVLTASGFLYGLAASDLKPEELDARDRLYEVIVGIRAVKP
jgi:SAM-dependent methyltransferase